MNILCAILGTGNRHLSRAQEIISYLKKIASLKVLISGNQSQLNVRFEIDYKCNGLTFQPSKNGKVALFKAIIESQLFNFIKEIKQCLKKKYLLFLNL